MALALVFAMTIELPTGAGTGISNGAGLKLANDAEAGRS